MNEYSKGSKANKAFSRDDIFLQYGSQCIDIENFEFIDGVTTLDRIIPNKLIFIDSFSDRSLKAISAAEDSGCLFILPREYKDNLSVPRIITDYPREIYSEITIMLFDYFEKFIYQSEIISTNARIDESSKIMSNVFISDDVTIGKDCLIMPNVVIGPKTYIGDNVIIKSNTVISQPGFGVYESSNGKREHLPHVGGVVIENNVELGALNTVVAGTIHPTVIKDYVKTDDHVHIAHNDYIGSRSQLAAHTLLSGSVTTGENVWFGPNCSVIDHVSIGNNVVIGIAANVIDSIEDNVTVVGNPARNLK